MYAKALYVIKLGQNWSETCKTVGSAGNQLRMGWAECCPLSSVAVSSALQSALSSGLVSTAVGWLNNTYTHTLEWPPPGAPFPECTLFLLPLFNLRRMIYPDLTLPTQLAPGIHISEHCLGGRPHAECFSCFFIPGGRYYYSPFINVKLSLLEMKWHAQVPRARKPWLLDANSGLYNPKPKFSWLYHQNKRLAKFSIVLLIR